MGYVAERGTGRCADPLIPVDREMRDQLWRRVQERAAASQWSHPALFGRIEYLCGE